MRPQPRARYYGRCPAAYLQLNRGLFPGLTPETATIALPFAAAATLEHLDSQVKVVPLPAEISPQLSAGAIDELWHLRQEGLLTALRGGRPTDLPRPLAPELRRHVRATCPHLVELLHRVETGLAGSHLFVRAVKIDDARASTTRPDADPRAEHLHLDAELSSLEQYHEPVYQFYANAATQPRQFRLLPLPLGDIVAELLAAGQLTAEEARQLPVKQVLARFVATHNLPLEVVPVPAGHLAIFDGRTFAHDAGKGDLQALLGGRFEPAAEKDLVLALDTTLTGYHLGWYQPELPLLEDPSATPAAAPAADPVTMPGADAP